MSSLDLRRLRQNEHVRALTREVHVQLDQLTEPLFVAEEATRPEPVPGLTGVHQESGESLLRQVEQDLAAGVHKFLLFGVPRARAERQIDGSFTASQVRALKARFGRDIWLATDVCLCSSTPHGHCGVLSAEGDHVDNDASIVELVQAALAYSQAGADCVAPSDMMDGRIGAIRAALQDRASYQLDPARPSDAWLCAERDAAQGADILMVKPGLPYLDLLRELSRAIRKPWAVYHVSGEFAALEALAAQGLANRAALHREILIAFRRAGASMIITYGARYARDWLAA